MTAFQNALKRAYDFKPFRTAAQVLAPAVASSVMFDLDWKVSLGLAGAAGLACFLQIVGEGGQLFAERKPEA